MAKNDSDINIRNYDKGDHNKVIQLVSNIIYLFDVISKTMQKAFVIQVTYWTN